MPVLGIVVRERVREFGEAKRGARREANLAIVQDRVALVTTVLRPAALADLAAPALVAKVVPVVLETMVLRLVDLVARMVRAALALTANVDLAALAMANGPGSRRGRATWNNFRPAIRCCTSS